MTNGGRKKPENQATFLKGSTSSFVLSENYCKAQSSHTSFAFRWRLYVTRKTNIKRLQKRSRNWTMSPVQHVHEVLSHYYYIQVVCVFIFFHFKFFFFYFLFSCLNLFLSSWRTEKGRRRGGGLSPVGKVKLPATELCIKPLLWQLKLSPALCPQCSLLLLLHLPFLFPSHWRGNSFYTCCNYYFCSCTCLLCLGVRGVWVCACVGARQIEMIEMVLSVESSRCERPTCLEMFWVSGAGINAHITVLLECLTYKHTQLPSSSFGGTRSELRERWEVVFHLVWTEEAWVWHRVAAAFAVHVQVI